MGISLKPSTKLALYALVTFFSSGIIYLMFLFVDPNMHSIVYPTIGFVSGSIVTSVFIKLISNPLDKIEKELHENGYVSEENKQKLKSYHYNLSTRFPIVVAILVAVLFLGINLIIDVNKFLVLTQSWLWHKFLFTESVFFLSVTIMGFLFDFVIIRFRKKAHITSTDKRDKVFGLLGKLLLLVIGLVLFAGSASLQSSVSTSFMLSDFTGDRYHLYGEYVKKSIEAKKKTIINYERALDLKESLNNDLRIVENLITDLEKQKDKELDEGQWENLFKKSKEELLKVESIKIYNEFKDVLHGKGVIINLIVIGISILIVLIFTRGLKLEIGYLRSGLKNLLNERDLSTRLSITGLDEIAYLTNDLNLILANQKKEILDIKYVSEKISNSSQILDDSVDMLSGVINEIKNKSEKTKTLSEKQLDVISATKENISNILSSIKNVNSEITDQTSVIEESSATIEEMTASIGSVDNLTKDSSKISSKLVDLAKSGSKYIIKNNEAMIKIKKSSDTISQIITSISDIADTTNTLSINASIEAARAGEAGQGFAVVANEIRALANTASESAREIYNNVSEMTELTDNGVELSSKADEAFKEILNGVIDTNNLMQKISEAMTEQRLGAKDVLKAITILVDSSEKIKDLSDEQKDKSSNIETSANSIVYSSNDIQEASETQVTAVRSIIESIHKLKSISEENKQGVDSLKKLIDTYKYDNKDKILSLSSSGYKKKEL